MGSPPPVWAARVPEPCVPPAWRYPAPSAPLAGAPPASGPPPGSFRPHVRTPAGSARIVPLLLSCFPKPSFLLGLKARNKVYDLWFTGGARSKHRKGPIQSSELNNTAVDRQLDAFNRYLAERPTKVPPCTRFEDLQARLV